MGGALSAVRNAMDSADKEEMDMAKEALDQLKAQGDKVAQLFRMKIEDKYKDAKELETWQVAGGRMDRFNCSVHVATSSQPSTAIEDGVKGMVGTLFGENKSDEHDKLVTNLNGIIGGLFDALLGNTEASEVQQEEYLIIPYGFAIFRVDIMLWKYNMHSKGFKDHFESITVSCCSRGILDVKDLRPAEIIAYMQQVMGADDADALVQRTNQICTIYQAVNKISFETQQNIAMEQNLSAGGGSGSGGGDGSVTTSKKE